VNYADVSLLLVSLLLFFMFRVILLMVERVYDVYWYAQLGKNWDFGPGPSEEQDIQWNDAQVSVLGNLYKRKGFWSILCGGKTFDYYKILNNVKCKYMGYNLDFKKEIDVFENELRNSWTFDHFLISRYGPEKLLKDYRRKYQ